MIISLALHIMQCYPYTLHSYSSLNIEAIEVFISNVLNGRRNMDFEKNNSLQYEILTKGQSINSPTH